LATEEQIRIFTTLLRRLGVLFSRIAGKHSFEHGTYSKQELTALDVLGLTSSSRMGEIAGYLGVVQSAITPLIDRLEEKGLVRRFRSSEDRRVWIVELTDSGQEVYKAQEKVCRVVAHELLLPLNEKEQETLILLLDRIEQAVEDHI